MQEKTQGERILMLLHASWPNWTPAPQLAQISLQYCARLRELRSAGWHISNKVEFRGRQKLGFYRLGSPPTSARMVSAPADNLFRENLAPQRYPD